MFLFIRLNNLNFNSTILQNYIYFETKQHQLNITNFTPKFTTIINSINFHSK